MWRLVSLVLRPPLSNAVARRRGFRLPPRPRRSATASRRAPRNSLPPQYTTVYHSRAVQGLLDASFRSMATRLLSPFECLAEAIGHDENAVRCAIRLRLFRPRGSHMFRRPVSQFIRADLHSASSVDGTMTSYGYGAVHGAEICVTAATSTWLMALGGPRVQMTPCPISTRTERGQLPRRRYFLWIRSCILSWRVSHQLALPPPTRPKVVQSPSQ